MNDAAELTRETMRAHRPRVGPWDAAPEAARPLVLAVDDEPRITKVVTMSLADDGFRVITAGDGRAAMRSAEAHRPDIVLLDIGLPDIDGIALMARLREARPVPVILLTALGASGDTARGLDRGADDYIAKPFHPDELAARVRAVLRRSASEAPHAGILRFDDVVVDLGRRIVTRHGELVQLSRTEWLVLEQLAANAGRVVRHTELLARVWGAEYSDELQYLRVWMSRIRRKLGAGPGDAGRIRTIPGIGYVLDVDAGPPPGEPAAGRAADPPAP